MKRINNKRKERLFPTKIDFYTLSAITLCLLGYLIYYVPKSNSIQKNLASKLTEQEKQYGEIYKSNNDFQNKWVNEMNTTSKLRGDINSLKSQLNQKPTTVYVPQTTYVPTYQSPRPVYTDCTNNILTGGISCRTY